MMRNRKDNVKSFQLVKTNFETLIPNTMPTQADILTQFHLRQPPNSASTEGLHLILGKGGETYGCDCILVTENACYFTCEYLE